MEPANRSKSLWWLAITSPIVALLMIKPVEAIAATVGISMFYGIEKGVHWYCFFWFVLTLFAQLILGTIALAEPNQAIDMRRLLRVTIFTSLVGVMLCFAGVWMLLYIAYKK